MTGMIAPTAVESAPELAETSGLARDSFAGAEALGGQRAQQLLGVVGDVVDHVNGVFFGKALDLVVERKQFAGLGTVHLDGFALAGDFSVIDFAFAFGGEVSAGAHGERGGNHAGEAGEKNILAGLGRSPTVAPETPETMPKMAPRPSLTP